MNMLSAINAMNKTPVFTESKSTTHGLSQIKLKKNFQDNKGKIDEMLSSKTPASEIKKATGVSLSTIAKRRSLKFAHLSKTHIERVGMMISLIETDKPFTFNLSQLAKHTGVSVPTASRDVNTSKLLAFGDKDGIRKKVAIVK